MHFGTSGTILELLALACFIWVWAWSSNRTTGLSWMGAGWRTLVLFNPQPYICKQSLNPSSLTIPLGPNPLYSRGNPRGFPKLFEISRCCFLFAYILNKSGHLGLPTHHPDYLSPETNDTFAHSCAANKCLPTPHSCNHKCNWSQKRNLRGGMKPHSDEDLKLRHNTKQRKKMQMSRAPSVTIIVIALLPASIGARAATCDRHIL